MPEQHGSSEGRARAPPAGRHRGRRRRRDRGAARAAPPRRRAGGDHAARARAPLRPPSLVGAEPFGLGGPASLDLEALARDQGAELRRRHAHAVDTARRVVVLDGGRELELRRPRRRGRRACRVRPCRAPSASRVPARRAEVAAVLDRHRTRRAPPARLRGPGRDDVVAAGLRARHDGRGRPARPWGRERHARHRHRGGRAARPVRAPPPAPRCARCSTRATSRCGHAAGPSSPATACSSSTPARRCAPTR